MPQGLPAVIPNAIVESAHVNSIADRIVGRFATTAERDTAIPAPVNGMVCAVAGVLYVRTGNAWVLVNPPGGYFDVAYRASAVAVPATTWTTVVSSVLAGMPAGKYLAFGLAMGVTATVPVAGQYRLSTSGGDSITWTYDVPVSSTSTRARHLGTALWPFSFGGGQLTVNLQLYAYVAGLSAWDGTTAGFVYLGN